MSESQQVAHGVQDKLLHIFLMMGSEWILYLLIVLSIASLAVALERVVNFYLQRDEVELLGHALGEHLSRDDVEGARGLLQGRRSPMARIVLRGLDALGRGPEAVEEIMAGATQVERLRMERGIAFLGTLGNNAPFIGLFGTVLGIIRAFRDLSTNTMEGSSAVMAGIAEALVATAVGLMVALPAVAVFNLLQRRIRVQLTAADALARVILAYAKSARG